MSKNNGFWAFLRFTLITPIFWATNGPLHPPQELAQQHEQHENVVSLVSRHGGNENIGGCAQQIDIGPKNSTFGPKKGHFGQSGLRNGPPSGQTATYRKTEDIQSYLRIWGTYDSIVSDPSDPNKWGLYGCSVKKCKVSGQKCPKSIFFGHCPNFLFTIMTGHLNDNIFVLTPLHGGPGGGAGAHFWPENLLFIGPR